MWREKVKYRYVSPTNTLVFNLFSAFTSLLAASKVSILRASSFVNMYVRFKVFTFAESCSIVVSFLLTDDIAKKNSLLFVLTYKIPIRFNENVIVNEK